MEKNVNTYIIKVNPHQDIDILDSIEEREELEEIIDEEIMEAQEQIELWCNEYKADYNLIENHRCIVTVYSLYTNEILPGTLKAIEDNLLEETYITFEIEEEY